MHRVEHSIAQYSSVVDERIEPAEGLESRRDQGLGGSDASYRLTIGSCFAATLFDYAYYLFCGRVVDIVDDDAGAFGSERDGDGLAYACSGPRNYRNLACEPPCHVAES